MPLDLVEFLDYPEENVVLHALAAFGEGSPLAVIERLVEKLLLGDKHLAPVASEALRLIGSDAAIHSLTLSHEQHPNARNWILATLGRMPPERIRNALRGQALLEALEPMLLVAPGANWLSSKEMAINISFLLKQNV